MSNSLVIRLEQNGELEVQRLQECDTPTAQVTIDPAARKPTGSTVLLP